MNIIYKCYCMNAERTCVVTDRVAGSDIKDWMELVVQPCLTYHHKAHSPKCGSLAMEYVKIHVPDDGGEIGVPVSKQ